MQNYIDVAILAAKEASGVHLKYFNTDVATAVKDEPFNLVTAADLEAEKVIVHTIKKYFPEHNFLAEEGEYEKTDSEYTWVIDPLDGTNNFASGIPIFCVSIALAKNDEVIVGVIYDIVRNELFYAQKSQGAFLNEKKITVNSVQDLSRAILITGFYYDRGVKMVENLDRIKQFFQKQVLGIRRFGSAALDLCYVAAGRAAGFWEFELNVWDFAAGKLIIEEAGGVVSTREGNAVPLANSFIVASNNKIHDKMLEILH